MEIHCFLWKIHYKWPFSIAMLNYQRVNEVNGIYIYNIMGIVRCYNAILNIMNKLIVGKKQMGVS